MEAMITISRSEYEQMKAKIASITNIEKSVQQLMAKNATLKELVKRLTEEIAFLKNERNSKTSSTAPSYDIGRSNR